MKTMLLAAALLSATHVHALETGDVIDGSNKAAGSPENWERFKHKARIDTDDVVNAIDAATGKTKWKRVFASAGRNPGTGKRKPTGLAVFNKYG